MFATMSARFTVCFIWLWNPIFDHLESLAFKIIQDYEMLIHEPLWEISMIDSLPAVRLTCANMGPHNH